MGDAELLERDRVHVGVNHGIEALPERECRAGVFARTGLLLGEARYGRYAAFDAAQDIACRNIARAACEKIAASLPPHAAENVVARKAAYELLEVFYRHILAVCDFFEGDGAAVFMVGDVNHEAHCVAPFCRDHHGGLLGGALMPQW